MYEKNHKLKVKCTSLKGQVSTAEITVIDFEQLEFLGNFHPPTLESYDVMFWLGEFFSDGGCSELKFEIEDVFTRIYDGVETRFFLTGICEDTRNYTWYSLNEILDPRPIEQICAILHEFYSDQKQAIKLLKEGDILHLDKKYRDCKFIGSNKASTQKQRYSNVENFDFFNADDHPIYERRIQFINFNDVWGWSNKLLGSFEALHEKNLMSQPSQINMF